jgi:undecaprenyl diphosphate synthase
MKERAPKEIPSHIGIIMDGNSRWAKVRGLNAVYGHREGAERVREVSNYCSKIGVSYLSLFAFSTENWQRPDSEVNALMDLLVDFLESQIEEINENNIRLLISGRKNKFSPEVLAALKDAENNTKDNTGLNLILCLDYGGRQEILDASNAADVEKIDEENFRNYLYLPQIPDIDLLIRTSGETRISNFMLWQLSYAELYFSPVLWPDVDVYELEKALKSFNRRQRRFGLRI